MSTSAVTMLIITAAVCSLLLVAQGQMDDEEWIDPYDMLNYDPSTKTMRKPAEVSQLPSCNLVFKQILTKFLKEIKKFGLPSDFQNDLYYDAKVRLSRQALAEIWKLLEGMDTCRMGDLDDALSQILVDLKPHELEASRWHFEDTFGVEIDTVMKVFVCVLIIVVIVCSELWSTVSWFVQFKRIFTICFLICLVWFCILLYKIDFAVDAKCTGKIDWWNLNDWYRGAMTLQEGLCKMYNKVLTVSPILLVPQAKHFGQRISELLVAIKVLPVTRDIPVLLIVLSILVFMYYSCQAAIKHCITRLLRIGRPRDTPPPAMDQPEPQAHLRGTNHDPLAGGEALQCSPPRNVETLRNDDWPFSNAQEEVQQPVVGGATTAGNDSQEAKPSLAKAKPNERDVTSESKVATDGESKQLAETQPSPTTQGNNTQEKSSEEKMSSISGQHGETDRVPVQETEPTSLAL
ncbi:chloride channel CLIC-like protein 1 [Oncorhynchus tshawytscha]|uniref:Chloride channel CLIC-like protein 1 n=1 Tax=Oncorhynchus tshawytscha TaxID=74940 RepID=A0A8C8F1B6_ONCTS|nr:chloride channel CLIC-like protein 1 [Oncorhynchus tshawytscha]